MGRGNWRAIHAVATIMLLLHREPDRLSDPLQFLDKFVGRREAAPGNAHKHPQYDNLKRARNVRPESTRLSELDRRMFIAAVLGRAAAKRRSARHQRIRRGTQSIKIAVLVHLRRGPDVVFLVRIVLDATPQPRLHKVAQYGMLVPGADANVVRGDVTVDQP